MQLLISEKETRLMSPLSNGQSFTVWGFTNFAKLGFFA